MTSLTIPLTEFAPDREVERRSISLTDTPRQVMSIEGPRSHVQNDYEAWGTEGNLAADLGIEQVNLPRADGGLEAWLFLAGCFTIEALVWGFPYSFGVFQDHYNSLPLFAPNSAGIAIIGTSASGVLYLGAPFIFSTLQAWPRFRRFCSPIGLVIVTIALIASSFSTAVWHLIMTQGVLYAIGGSLLYAPTILYLDEWFITRKGFAYGVMWAGTGVSGVALPFFMAYGLSAFGFRTILRAWAVTVMVLASPLIYYVKPRIPYNPLTASHPRRISFGFLLTPTFWNLQFANIVQGLGFFIPNFYLPQYARSLDLAPISGSLILALFNLTSVLGQIGFGILIDRIEVTSVILISSIGTAISVFIFWGLGVSLPLLCIFALLYGIFGGGFTSTWTGMMKAVQDRNPGAETGMIFGILGAGRGIGAVISGPVGERLLAGLPWKDSASLGYGTGYGGLIVFTGITGLCSGLAFIGKRAKLA